jgi:Tfp pilus assembly protein PilN
MKCMNLMSQHRREEQARCTCMARWSGCLAAWACLISVACIAAAALSNMESNFESSRSAIVLRTTAAQASASASSSQIDRIRKRLEVARAVEAHPDWSVLLPVVSSRLGDDIALERISLEPVRGEEATRRATMTLNGVGTDRAALSDFVIRLEETGVFTRVETATAQRRPIGQKEFFAFELRCRVGSGWEGASP